jgi:hypothetical protein
VTRGDTIRLTENDNTSEPEGGNKSPCSSASRRYTPPR